MKMVHDALFVVLLYLLCLHQPHLSGRIIFVLCEWLSGQKSKCTPTPRSHQHHFQTRSLCLTHHNKQHILMQIQRDSPGKVVWLYRIAFLYLASLWNVDATTRIPGMWAVWNGSGVICPAVRMAFTESHSVISVLFCSKKPLDPKIILHA